MKVMVLGLRGIPGVQGGVETHAEHLYGRVVAAGCQVDLIVRTQWVPTQLVEYQGIRIHRIWAPTKPGLEALVHSLLGVFYAAWKRPDILHVHAVGPAVVTPIARLLGLKVVVTHHGPDYDRDKWGRFARWFLRTGESLGMRWSNARIVISRVIAGIVRDKYGLDSDLIPNGVDAPPASPGNTTLGRWGLTKGRYVLQVSRLVPEKRQLDLVAAFLRAKPQGWKLVLVGGIDQNPYCAQLQAAALADEDVILTGFLSGEPLREIYANAGCFVLPSSHEGLPIALLEALSFGLRVIASDIPANLEIGLPEQSYFRTGDVGQLADRLTSNADTPDDPVESAARRDWVLAKYDWNDVARQTCAVYERVLAR